MQAGVTAMSQQRRSDTRTPQRASKLGQGLVWGAALMSFDLKKCESSSHLTSSAKRWKLRPGARLRCGFACGSH